MAARSILTVMPDLPVPPVTGVHLRIMTILQVARTLAARSSAIYFEHGAKRGDPNELASICDNVISGGAVGSHVGVELHERVVQRLGFLSNAARRQLGTSYPMSLPYDAISA